MLDAETTQICSNCGTPVRTSNLVCYIAFPDDLEHIVDFLHQRLNVVPCPVCGNEVPFLVPLVIQRRATHEALAAAGEETMPEIERIFGQSDKSIVFERCGSYDELFEKLKPWLNDEIVPGLNAVAKSEWPDSRAQRIAVTTPLLLALLQAQVNNTLPFSVLQMSGDPAAVRNYQQQLLATMIHDLAHDLVMEAAIKGELHAILSSIQKHIPAATLSPQLLDYSVKQCVPDPLEVLTTKDRNNVAPAYRYELINALFHFYARLPNPRCTEWAIFLRQFWLWSRTPKFQIDEAFFQTPEIIRATTRFQDLWNLSFNGVHTQDSNELKALFAEVGDMMQRFGFADEFEEMNAAGPLRITSGSEQLLANQDRFVKILRERAFQSLKFNSSPEESRQAGLTIGILMEQTMANFPPSVAESLLLLIIEDALQAEDAIAAVSLVAYGIEPLNRAQSWSFVARLIQISESLLDQPEILKIVNTAEPELWTQYFNELGNFYRYTDQFSEALAAYDELESRALANKHELSQPNRATLASNRAIVYRSLGQYKKALSLFDEAISAEPTVVGFHHSKAVLLLEVGDLDQALAEIDTALSLANVALRNEYGLALITRARIKSARGESESALDDLQTASEDFAAAPEEFQLPVAAFAVEVATTNPSYQPFLKDCEAKITAALPHMFEEGHLGLASQTIYALANRLLNSNDHERADLEFGPYLDQLENLAEEAEVDLDWRLSFIRAKLEHANQRYDLVWPYLLDALEKSNRDVPAGDESEFSISWLTGKEEFQTELSTIALELYRKKLVPATEFLRIYEFCNGREISARLQAVEALDIAPETLLRAIYEISTANRTKTHLVFLIESSSEIVVGYHAPGADAPILLADDTIDAATLRKLRDRMREALKFANPANLEPLDEVWSEWNNLWKAIGNKLDASVNEGEQVCILPGRICTGLPMHLIPIGAGRTLFDKSPVTYAPNLATLLDVRVPKNKYDRRLLVAVSKKTDTQVFTKNLSEATQVLAAALGKTYEVELLEQQAATLERLREALQKSHEVIFLTHGSYGGPRRGFGICISDGENLPPGLLPVDEVPELERFLLTWDDIDELVQTPAIVVSIACSSGQTLVSRGGVRFGLEQSLFASGTRVIVSPLWDIDQMAALSFVKTFYDLKMSTPEMNAAKLFQRACFALRDDFPHPYFWSAFFFNGSLMEALS